MKKNNLDAKIFQYIDEEPISQLNIKHAHYQI